MKFDLKNKTAIVTGASSGIGQAIATVFAEHRAKVIILDVNKQKGQQLEGELQNNKNIAQFVYCDVTNQSAVVDVMNKIASDHGIDILVNNAGIAHVGNVEQTTEEDFDKVYQVNVKGVYNCLKACVPHMKTNGGAILNVASIASSVGISDRFAYSMTKGAVLTMTYSIAKDYIDDGIRCNSISPARVHTPFVDHFIQQNYPGEEEKKFTELSKTQPIGRMANPEEVANMALYLCSDEAAFLTGTDYPIDGGFIKLNG